MKTFDRRDARVFSVCRCLVLALARVQVTDSTGGKVQVSLRTVPVQPADTAPVKNRRRRRRRSCSSNGGIFCFERVHADLLCLASLPRCLGCDGLRAGENGSSAGVCGGGGKTKTRKEKRKTRKKKKRKKKEAWIILSGDEFYGVGDGGSNGGAYLEVVIS